MQQIKSPWIRGLIHIFLILWVIYSTLPFVMTIITSSQVTRDAIAREPRFMPEWVVNNNLMIALVIAVIIIGVYLLMATVGAGASSPDKVRRGDRLESGMKPVDWGILGMILLVVVGGFLAFTNTLDDDHFFSPTWNNYQEIWLSVDIQTFIPVGIGLIVLIFALVAVGIYGSRFPKYKTYVYLGIVAVVVGTIIYLPQIIQFAEFYDFFLNSVIVTVGTVVVSISIGCLAGYGLARYSGISGFIILIVALGFRALPRMAFILPYYYFAQISGLYDTYLLLIITFVAINQPFTIWMLRSFFMEIPREIEEAAMIDGCNRLTSFTRVIIPIMWPGIITTALFSLLLAYNEFLLARLLTATTITLPVGISRFTSGEDVRILPLSSASAVSITLPIVFIILFFQRYLIKGLAGGAVKG